MIDNNENKFDTSEKIDNFSENDKQNLNEENNLSSQVEENELTDSFDNEEVVEQNLQEEVQEKPKKKKPKKEKNRAIINNNLAIANGEIKYIDIQDIPYDYIKQRKSLLKRNKKLEKTYSKSVLYDDVILTNKDFKPNFEENIIELKNVRKSYATNVTLTPVLKGIDLEIKKGRVVIILGPSGSGKTTLLNVISGLDKPDCGDVLVGGCNLFLLKDHDLTKFRRDRVGFIFQQYNLLSNLTARENVAIGENLKHGEGGLTINHIFEKIGMHDQIDKYPYQMSGGQQQRVSIARAVAKNPDILFGDEPTGALDEEMGRKVLNILIDINKSFGTTVIIVTHNNSIAKIGDQVIVVANGQIVSNEINPNPLKPDEVDWS